MTADRRTTRSDMLCALRMLRRGCPKAEIARQLGIRWRALNACFERAALLYLELVEAADRQQADDRGRGRPGGARP